MSNENSEYNGVIFYRPDVEFKEDLIIPIQAEEILKTYLEQYDAGFNISAITICSDGTLLLHAQKEEETT